MAILRIDQIDGKVLSGHEVTEGGTLYIPLRRRTLIGRGQQCDVVIASGRIARQDTVFEPDGESWTAVNLGNNAGMWVNGQKVMRAVLRDGDAIFLFAVTLRFFSTP